MLSLSGFLQLKNEKHWSVQVDTSYKYFLQYKLIHYTVVKTIVHIGK